MGRLYKFAVFFTSSILSVSFFSDAQAGKLIVGSDMAIADADYSNNWGDCGVCVTNNNGGNPWNIDLSGTLKATNNAFGLIVDLSGMLNINGVGSNMVVDFRGNNAANSVGINNEGYLSINGGAYGGVMYLGDNTAANVLGLQSLGTRAKTYFTNMDIDASNMVSSSTYITGMVNEGVMDITSTSGNNTIVMHNNDAKTFFYGIRSQINSSSLGLSTTTINNYNFDIQHNNSTSSTVGMSISGKMIVNGMADGSNLYNFTNNTSTDFVLGMVVYANGGINQGSLDITNMNINISDNEGARLFGIRGETARYIKLTGVANGSNSVVFSNNTATTGGMSGIQMYASGALDIENMNILISGNTAGTYLYGIHGNDTRIKGVAAGTNAIVIKDNISGSSLFYGIVNSGSMDIDNMNIEISNNTSTASNAAGIYNSGTLNVTGVASRNTMILKDNKTAGFWTASSSASTNVKNMNIAAEGNIFSIVLNGASFGLDNTAVAINDASNAFEFGGTGNVINVKNGSSIATNGGQLMSVGASSGVVMNVDASFVTGGVETYGTSDMNLSNSSTWVMKSDSNLSNINSTNSTIDLRSSTGAYNTLTVNNYVGNGSVVFLNTYFGGDNSPTDKIVVDGGNATGSTILNISSTGGNANTSGDGIKVVDAQNGATVGAGSFALAGGKVDTSAFEYYLYQGDLSGTDTQSMFLRTTGKLSNTAKAIANEPSSTIVLVRAGMNSLMKRMGELRNTNECDNSGVWARTYAKSTHVDDKVESRMNFFGFEAGVDTLISEAYSSDRIFAGVMAGYIYTDNIKTPKTGGDGHGNTPSVGAYITWLNSEGWFVDGVLRHFWMKTDMNSHASGGQQINYSVDRQATAFSIETGRKMVSDIDENSRFVVEPKVELGYAVSRAETTYTSLGDRLKYENTESYSSKAAILLGYERKFDDGTIIEPYFQFGIIHEFDGRTDVNYGAASYDSNFGGTSFEVGGGLNAKTSEHTSAYAELMYEKGSTIESVSANVGFRYTF